MQFKPISATRAQALLSQRAKLLTDVSQSLSGGPPINWKAGDRAGYTAQLRGLGFNLVTRLLLDSRVFFWDLSNPS